MAQHTTHVLERGQWGAKAAEQHCCGQDCEAAMRTSRSQAVSQLLLGSCYCLKRDSSRDRALLFCCWWHLQDASQQQRRTPAVQNPCVGWRWRAAQQARLLPAAECSAAAERPPVVQLAAGQASCSSAF